ncbi:right-handed parallel beta-helix repeat-containing protein [Thermoanaerobacterium thermosaccharolyticum]|uniref:right-handed parallel beta-helix repeat-containing protein n=1 Tax=Thermoanaerobacterium thermosaccharolyticum TaxID=1517 RepID=UPI003DA8AD1F
MLKRICRCMSFVFILTLLFTMFMSSNASAATNYYVSPTGSDSNSGTSVSTPFKTIEKAVSLAAAGSTIYLMPGTYKYGTNMIGTIVLGSKSGASTSNMTKICAYDLSSKPVLDFSGQPVSSSSIGINITGGYWELSGLIIKNCGDNGILMKGSSSTHNIINSCETYNNADTGIQISSGASYNTVKYCVSKYNVDASQGNADGFACKLSPGEGNTFDNCIAEYNSDDGWDLYACYTSVKITNCKSNYNGYLSNGSATSGNGEGFKLGGSDANVAHIVTNCTAIGNQKKGFSSNNNPGHTVLTNCIAYEPKTIASGVTYYNFSMIDGPVTINNCYSYQYNSTATSTKYRIKSGSTVNGGNMTANY